MAKWSRHDGKGRPVPVGTLVEVEMFNGVRRTLAGKPIPAERSAGWSAWRYDDGGPMGPKFKAYRVIMPANSAMRDAELFRSWLNVRPEDITEAA